MKTLLIAFYIILALLVLIGLFYKFIFLRDNNNIIPEGNNILAPSSGKVISIEEVNPNTPLDIKKGFMGHIETEITGENPYWLINIFMSPLDVHIQKMPIDGTFESIQHTDGEFNPVNTVANAIKNEKKEYIINTKIGKIKVIQIAGFLARRTRSWVSVNDSKKQGEAFGIILLGSQTAILVPKNKCELQIKIGDRTNSGETILCKIKE